MTVECPARLTVLVPFGRRIERIMVLGPRQNNLAPLLRDAPEVPVCVHDAEADGEPAQPAQPAQQQQQQQRQEQQH